MIFVQERVNYITVEQFPEAQYYFIATCLKLKTLIITEMYLV